MADAGQIRAGKAFVEVSAEFAKGSQSLEAKKAQIAAWAKDVGELMNRSRQAGKSGDAAASAEFRAMASARKAMIREATREMQRAYVVMSGGTPAGEHGGTAYGMTKFGRAGRGFAHLAAMFGGEGMGHAMMGFSGAGHLWESGKESIAALGFSSTIAMGAVAGLAIGVSKLGEWARESTQQMHSLNLESMTYSERYTKMVQGGPNDRTAFLREELKKQQEELSKLNTEAQHGDDVSTATAALHYIKLLGTAGIWDDDEIKKEEEAHRERIRSTQNNISKLQKMLADAEKEGPMSSASQWGGALAERSFGGSTVMDDIRRATQETAQNTRQSAIVH